MQDIVYKLVPGFQESEYQLCIKSKHVTTFTYLTILVIFSINVLDEIKREKEFYRLRDLPYPKDIPAMGSEAETERPSANGVPECDFHRMDEQVFISCTAFNS